MNGYIYIRTNEYWDLYDAYKLGKTSNILDRENNYITSEVKRGKYMMIIELNIDIMDNIEKQLQEYFNKLGLHIKFNAGIEFYKKEIENKIIPYLKNNKIIHKVLTEEEIMNLIRKTRINKKVCILKENILKPYPLQKPIIDNAYNYFQKNNKGLLILTCGVGKTLISLWITMKLNLQTIIIGVPNILLLNQWKETILKLFDTVACMTVASGVKKDNIIKFINENINKCIIITTYASSYKVVLATSRINFKFDMKINDECHHLTSINMELDKTTQKNVEMLKISCNKQISLTATIKQLENSNNDDNIISNDNEKHFGNIIDRKCLLWAIENDMVCDYIIQTIITDENELEELVSNFNITEEIDKLLFLSAYSSLKSINDNISHHILIYSNSMVNSLKLIKYINLLLEHQYFSIDDLYSSNYDSTMNLTDQTNILTNFEKATYGIITCVYCLGEGYDLPLLDAVVFSEAMTSNIRIVQSGLRAGRKNRNDPDKITKIILPILNRKDWLDNTDNNDFKKVREVIYQMGLEDETIIHKIKVYKIDITKHIPKVKTLIMIKEFGYYDDELTQKIRLKTTKRFSLGITYEKARKIISDKNITRINKEIYYELCNIDNRLPINPEEIFKGTFNWIDYLNIPRTYYNLDECIKIIKSYLSENPDIKKNYLDLAIVNEKLCKLDDMFPPYGLWVEYYNVKELSDIIKISNKQKKPKLVI